MKFFYNYLNDTSFLKKLTKLHVKTYFVKITLLNWGEEPIETIEGRVISANINIDGQSSLRRTANLSLVVDEEVTDVASAQNVLAINKKMVLEIGYVNETKEYPEYEILWFPLGTYVIMSCSLSQSDAGLTASIQLQDKMCLLNGSAGGTIPAAAQLHTMDTLDENGNEVTVHPTIYQIIQQLVHHWGGEQLGKIIISDLDNRVKQAMRWNLNTPLYLTQNENQYDFSLTAKETARVFTKGQDVGFIYTDFIYPGELIADAGSSVTDALDKIIEVLGNYEYFYDLDGNFIFQEKKNFLNNAQSYYILEAANNSNLVPDYIASQNGSNKLSAYLINMTSGTSAFEFEDSDFIKTYSNTPQYGSIKNDFVIWGLRQTENAQIPLRYHLAIDSEPMVKDTPYIMFNYKEYDFDKYGVWKMPILITDNENSKYGNPKIASTELGEAKNNIGHYYCEEGDLKIKTPIKTNGQWKWGELDVEPKTIVAKDWRTQLLLEGAAAQTRGLESNYYYEELKTEWPKIYDLENGCYYPEVIQNPSCINYYLDFISSGHPSIINLSVNNIGRRSFVTDNGKNTNCVFENWIPDIILIKAGQEDTEARRTEAVKRGQRFTQVPANIYDNLQIGGVYNSAYEDIRQTLHEFTNYNETISLQTLPLYFLQPNTRISVYNPKSGIRGDYLINSLSFSLDAEGLLTINASRAAERV